MSIKDIAQGYFIGQSLKWHHDQGEVASVNHQDMTEDLKLGISLGFCSVGARSRNTETKSDSELDPVAGCLNRCTLWEWGPWVNSSESRQFRNRAEYDAYLQSTVSHFEELASPESVALPGSWSVDYGFQSTSSWAQYVSYFGLTSSGPGSFSGFTQWSDSTPTFDSSFDPAVGAVKSGTFTLQPGRYRVNITNNNWNSSTGLMSYTHGMRIRKQSDNSQFSEFYQYVLVGQEWSSSYVIEVSEPIDVYFYTQITSFPLRNRMGTFSCGFNIVKTHNYILYQRVRPAMCLGNLNGHHFYVDGNTPIAFGGASMLEQGKLSRIDENSYSGYHSGRSGGYIIYKEEGKAAWVFDPEIKRTVSLKKWTFSGLTYTVELATGDYILVTYGETSYTFQKRRGGRNGNVVATATFYYTRAYPLFEKDVEWIPIFV